MKTEITNRNPTDAKLKIELDQSFLEPIRKHTIDHLRKTLKVAGFRPGKAPDHIVEREHGSAAIQGEVLEVAVKDSYAAAVREHNLPVIASPEISIIKFVPFTTLEFTAHVAIMPQVALPDLKKVKSKRQPVEVKVDEVERVILDLQRRMAERKPVERPASQGDEVNIDFQGSIDEQPVSGASSKSYDLILGSESFIPGFEAELVGLKPGETKQFDINFPKDYQSADLAGKKVRFKVVLNQVNQIDLPTIDADFVQKVSPLKTVDELKGDIKQRITDEKNDSTQRQYENAVLDELISLTVFEVPQVLLDQQIARLRADLENRLKGEGLDLPKYAQMQNLTIDQIDQEMRPEAEKRVKLAVLLTEFAKAENLNVTSDDIDAELARLKSLYPDPQMQAELKEPSTKEEIYNHLLATKTVVRILEKVETTSK